MPAYNTERYVAKAIESILSQTLKEFEFIIVDDGSTDKTLEIATVYARRDPVYACCTAIMAGCGCAQPGLECRRCSWVAIMHADDVALPIRLAVQWEMAQTDPEVVIWGTDGFHISANGQSHQPFPGWPDQ